MAGTIHEPDIAVYDGRERRGDFSKRPTGYVVQRSITRPASRQVDPPFQTIYEGDAAYFSDDEVAS